MWAIEVKEQDLCILRTQNPRIFFQNFFLKERGRHISGVDSKIKGK